MSGAFLSLVNVCKRFHSGPGRLMRSVEKLIGHDSRRTIYAVSNVNLSVARGEVVGLVGESGCGKSTTGRIVAGIYAPTEGRVLLDGQPVALGPDGAVRKLTTRVQMIHQDPFASLNPRMTIGDTLAEGPLAHRLIPQNAIRDTVVTLLQKVGLDATYTNRLPHQFSGGQRQRIAIARALAMQPDLLVLDEPVASLDVSIQAQIINLLVKLQQELGLTYLIITHDLSLVRHMADQVGVMYLGRFVESGRAAQVCQHPIHPYSESLLSSVAGVDPQVERHKPVQILQGAIPSPLALPSGCTFHTRCPRARLIANTLAPDARTVVGGQAVPAICVHSVPERRRVGPAETVVTCHFACNEDGSVPFNIQHFVQKGNH